MISQVREFLAINDVSPQLTERVVDYVNSTWSMNNATEDAVVRLCHLLPLIQLRKLWPLPLYHYSTAVDWIRVGFEI